MTAALDRALRFARTTAIGVARTRQVIVARRHRPAKFLTRRHSTRPSFARMIDGLLAAACLDPELCQERCKLRQFHGVNESRGRGR